MMSSYSSWNDKSMASQNNTSGKYYMIYNYTLIGISDNDSVRSGSLGGRLKRSSNGRGSFYLPGA